MTLKPHSTIPRRFRPRGLEILYEDRDLYVINKETGLLTTATRRQDSVTAENALNTCFRKGCARSSRQVYLVHRLDRETSGVMLFAKSEAAQQQIKDNWKATEKLYLAAVYGQLATPSGILSSYLAEDENQYVYSVPNPDKGRFSQTAYTVIRQTPTLSLIKIRLLTGRKNQIRVQFAETGHAVVGDRKYGKSDPFRERLCLHAKSIAFDHPHNGERLVFDTPIPNVFMRLAPGFSEKEWQDTPVP